MSSRAEDRSRSNKQTTQVYQFVQNESEPRSCTECLNSKTSKFILSLLAMLIIFVLIGISLRHFVFKTPAPAIEIIPKTKDNLISYKTTDKDYLRYVNSITNDLHVYKQPGLTLSRSQNIYYCDYYSPPPKGKLCDIDIRSWSGCTRENNYGYDRSSPCVFLKINTAPGWIPEFYNDTTELPEDMPETLKNYINETQQTFPQKLDTAWITCDGDTSYDKENVGPIDYLPMQGIPGYLLLNNDVEGYLSPIIPVKFKKPARGIGIKVICKIWVKNLKNQDTKEFELVID